MTEHIKYELPSPGQTELMELSDIVCTNVTWGVKELYNLEKAVLLQ